MKKNFFSIIKKLISEPAVGGLEISDSAIRFSRINGGKIATAYLRLPPGIILDGKINDRQNFLSALKTVHSQISKARIAMKIHVIVCLPASVVYSQSFSVPTINHENLEESVELNLQMVSPINLEKTYSDWQIIGGNAVQKDVIGAFAENSIINDYDQYLRESNFLPVAFEFPALSLIRLINEFWPEINADKSYLAINVSPEGLDFLIIRKKELYFNHFLFWRTLQGEKRQILFPDFRDALIQEIQKIVNFTSINYKETLEGAIIMTSALEKEIGEIIQKEFDFKIIFLRSKKYGNFSPVWFISLGLALRGLISRRQDSFISLTAHNVVEEFYHEQTLSFISLWRNIFFISLSILAIALAGVDITLNNIQKNTEARLSMMTSNFQIQEMGKLQEKALIFNESVALISNAKNSVLNWSLFFEELDKLAGDRIVFDRINIQSSVMPATITIQGQADSEQEVIDFKNNIAARSNFGNIELPLTGIHPVSDRRVSFNMNFVVKSLNW